MFTASLANGTTISLVDDWPLQELKELRKKDQFYCPVCKNPVVLKIGRKNHSHFAHHSKQGCSYLPERETHYHLTGKRDLYDWLTKQHVQVKMEYYLPIISQRPDLLFRYQNQLYALEFQCATIGMDSIEKRTEGYIQQGIIPLWIFGGNRLKRNGQHHFTLHTFEWFASYEHEKKRNLTYYCTEAKAFSQLIQLTPYTSQKVLAGYKETPLSKMTITTVLSPNTETPFMIQQWLAIKKHWRYQNPNPYPRATERYFQQLHYKHRLSPSLFPIEAGWPSLQYELLETSPYIWQTFLLLECLQHQPIHQPFHKHIVIQTMQGLIRNRLFPQRTFFQMNDWTLAIDGYLNWLEDMRYIKKHDPSQMKYVRLRDAIYPENAKQAIQLDHKCMFRVIEKNRLYLNSNLKKELN
ncbi:competence protein CoiA [Bacillus sp. JCM 19034]|uniref:competence protein CoiA n=1 Tax=Bacillus sp. JCM 19034 TaxID=1481928 RepID=UPI000785BEE5|nr:competence protein CoiA family protein [Bacillus sp. JCM 19034]